MKQQCHLSMIYLSWIMYLGGLMYLAFTSNWALALFWLILVPVVQWLYMRKFPSLSSALGYGRIADEPAAGSAPNAPAKVIFYTALGCPFCPLMEERLAGLGVPVEKIDVTLRPDLLASKGIRSVPVVEVGGRFLTGLVSTKDLAEAIGQLTLQM